MQRKLILSNDADTVPEPDALIRYVNYFIRPGARHIAAVTANMDVQNRTKLIAKSQTVEFSSIVGIIKRTQSAVFGGLYAYSGANTMYRKEALIDVGGFRQDRATEDISIAWDHQLNDWLSVLLLRLSFHGSTCDVEDAISTQKTLGKRWNRSLADEFQK